MAVVMGSSAEDIAPEKELIKKPAGGMAKPAVGTGSSRHNPRQLGMEILESPYLTFIMTTFTIYALFGDDIRIAFFDPGADDAFQVLTVIAFVLFAGEIVLSVYSKPGYFNHNCNSATLNSDEWYNIFKFGSFYFTLDLIATLSLILDISWFIQEEQKDEILSGDLDSGGASARAGRASKAGARASRVVRIVRMVRLVRLVKLYKYYTDSKEKKAKAAAAGEVVDDDEEAGEQSKIGAAMSDETTRRVIIIVLLMLVLIPVMSYDTQEMDQTYDFAANYLLSYHMQYLSDTSAMTNIVDSYLAVMDNDDLLSIAFLDEASGGVLEIDETYTTAVMGDPDGFLRKSSYDKLRFPREVYRVIVDADSGGSARGVHILVDNKSTAQEQALFSICLTSFIIVLLGLGTYIFGKDVNELVIFPIERMVKLVNTISENPLGFDYSKGVGDNKYEGMETTLLLTTITKIGGLMRVGFGEAGADIIADNLKHSTDHSLNLLSSGQKITSIFGFCDIRQFTDTTECLQEEVMLFVNRIAEVVHEIVVQCGGAANKNIGDAFLLTWKLNLEDEKQTTELADRALLAFCKIMAEMGRHQEYCCRFSVAATQRLLSRMPGYTVRMGNGLHIGWAIEGAIGSDRKIDASYISPHVNWSEYLESSTKLYGVPILMSEPFHSRMSSEAQKWCRQVDIVRRSEAEGKVALYTYDCDLDVDFRRATRHQRKVRPSNRGGSMIGIGQRSTSRRRLTPLERTTRRDSRLALGGNEMANAERPAAINLGPYTRGVWEEDADLLLMRHAINSGFMRMWEDAMEYYVTGKWDLAQQKLRACLKVKDRDGPALFLAAFMKQMSVSEEKCTPPEDWMGCREDG
mmetsp:Transcript_19219/g.58118  ORF Transcript_19219/g.58118 Transcript_19219/m.58118 type:complete len:859 (-) Transcript_19219:35-2611(-)